MADREKRIQRGRPTQDQLDIRKARVLKVAEALFTSQGFSGTSVAEIARRSQVSPRLVTAHFGDKQQIFAQAITQRTASAAEAFFTPGESADVDEILFDAAKFAWGMAYSPQSIRFLRMVVGEGERFLEMTSGIARQTSHDFYNAMELLFTNLIQRSLIEGTDAPRLAKYFVDLVVGFSLIQAGMGFWDRVPDDEELRDKIRFFRNAMAAEAAASRIAPKRRSAFG